MSFLGGLEQELITVFTGIFATRYMHVASSALLAWDYLITLDQEIEFFWQGRWSWPRALFFVNRYFPLIEQSINTAALTAPDISDEFCSVYLLGLFPGIVFAEIIVVQSIVIFRVYGLYGHNKTLLWCLIALLVSGMIAVIGITAYSSLHSVASSHGIPGLVVCGELSSVQIIYGAIVPLIVFDGIACLLVLWKAYVHVLRSSTRLPFASRLVAVIARDSLYYFVIGFVVYMGNAMIWRYGAPELGGLGVGLGVALLSVLGNRMLLNLRAEDAKDLTSTLGSAASGIEFVPGRSNSVSLRQGITDADEEFV